MVVLIGLVIIFKKQITTCWRTCSRRSTNSRKRCTDEKKRPDHRIFEHGPPVHRGPAGGADGIGQDRRGQVLSADCRQLRPGFCDGRIHRGLWERYRILLREFGGEEELSEEFKRYFDGYLEAAGWYPAQTEELLVEEAVPVTADGGAHLQQEVMDYMKYGVWALDFTEAEAGDVLDGLREASAVQETSRLYGTCSGKALQLERTGGADQQPSAGAAGASLRRSQTAGGRGWLRFPADRKGADQGAGGGAGRGGRLRGEGRCTPGGAGGGLPPGGGEDAGHDAPDGGGGQGGIREVFSPTRPGMGSAGGEIEALADLAGENLALTQSVMREAEDVMDYIDSWEGEEDEELDEDALWRPVRRHMEGFAVRILACAHGTADKEKQSFLEKYREDRRGWPAGLWCCRRERPSPGRRCWGASCRPPGEAPPAPPDPRPAGTLPPSGASGGGGTGGGGHRSRGIAFFRRLPAALAERLFTGEYCGQFFRHSWTRPRGNEMGMAYQMEYLVCGEMEGPGKPGGGGGQAPGPAGGDEPDPHSGGRGQAGPGQGAGGGDRGGLRPSAPGGGGGRAGDGACGRWGKPWRM